MTTLPSNAELLEVFKLVSQTGLAAALSGTSAPLEAGLFALGKEDGYLPPPPSEQRVAEFRAARLARQWSRIKEQSAYKWLSGRPEYIRAWQIFQRKKNFKRSSDKLKVDDADFKFVHAIVWALMVFLDQSDPARRRRFPSKRTALATRGHLKKLLAADLALLKLGENIRGALETLDRQLAEVATFRKVAENKTYAQRRFVTCLSYWFCTELDDTLYTAVRELCGLVNYNVSDAALHPQVRAVRRRWASALAKALRESAKIG